MIVPDANLLIYAHDQSSPHHANANRWWTRCLSGSEPVGIPMVVVLAFTRLMTHPGICEQPLTTEEVREIVTTWLGAPSVRLLTPSDHSIPVFFDLLQEAGMGGNLTTDALIAVQAREHSAIVYSNDRDFGRFPGLKWINPLQDP